MSEETDEKQAEQTLGTLIVRADASPQIGVGHVMRCLALAQDWIRQRGSVRFVCRELPDGLRKRLLEEAVEVVSIESQRVADAADIQATSQACRNARASLVVLDGYSFDDVYEQALQSEMPKSGKLLAFDDDQHATHQHADFILNQNLGADRLAYGERDGLLVGADYTLLRREFLDAGAAACESESDNARNVLVTLGGADPHNTTSLVLKALCQIDDPHLTVRVLAGVANPHLDAIEQIAESDDRVQIIGSTNDMLSFYRWTDIAISAGGATNWEMCYFGIPRCSVILANNQKPIIEALDRIGAVISLGWYAELSAERIVEHVQDLLVNSSLRRRMADINRVSVDGKGGVRIIREVMSHRGQAV